MSGYQAYSLVLCLIVFVLLTTLSVITIAIIYRQKVKLIKHGVEDDAIIAEHQKELNKKQSKLSKVLDYGVTLLLALIFVFAFAAATYMKCTEDSAPGNMPTYRVVKTDSMAKRNEKNTYLFSNDLNDQFDAMDIILVRKLPDEKDLKLYDIVVYEVDDILVVHRIVGIEEPNKYHPNERQFLLQGDAIDSPDRFPVLYSQMRGIYEGEKVPFVGSFVLFMQSLAGWLCLFLVVFAMVATPILEKALLKQRNLRLAIALAAIKEAEEKKALEEKLAKEKAEMEKWTANTVKIAIPPSRISAGKCSPGYVYLPITAQSVAICNAVAGEDVSAKKVVVRVVEKKPDPKQGGDV